MTYHFLVFNSHFDRDKGLDQGRLSLCSSDDGTIHIWRACSSYSTKQYRESFHERGGYIPPEYRVPALNHWRVETTPVNLSHVKGVAGDFFRILPFEVTTDKGGKRSDLGIHLDANAPGSMGCIVMDYKRFNFFKQAMVQMKRLTKELPLYIRYS